MASLNFTVPDAQMSRVVDAFGRDWTQASGVTKAQFAQEEVRKTFQEALRSRVRLYEADQQPEVTVS